MPVMRPAILAVSLNRKVMESVKTVIRESSAGDMKTKTHKTLVGRLLRATSKPVWKDLGESADYNSFHCVHQQGGGEQVR